MSPSDQVQMRRWFRIVSLAASILDCRAGKCRLAMTALGAMRLAMTVAAVSASLRAQRGNPEPRGPAQLWWVPSRIAAALCTSPIAPSDQVHLKHLFGIESLVTALLAIVDSVALARFGCDSTSSHHDLGHHSALASIAQSIAEPSLSTISPTWSWPMMNGGASSTWSPIRPSIVPPPG